MVSVHRHASADHDSRGGDVGRARVDHGDPRDEGRYFPEARSACYLRGAAVRRHGSVADGRVSHLLLRVPLPVHHRDRARRVEEHPGHRAHEAGVPSGHRHEPGDGRGRRLRQPFARVHASRRGPTLHHAVRRRQRAGRTARVLELDAQCAGDAGHCAESRPADLRDPARRVGAASVRRQSAHHRRSGRS